MQLTPYWLDTASQDGIAEAGPLPQRSDVVIVGGGLTGASAALALAQQGASVVVLEAGRIMSGASGRNGGHCNNGMAGNFHAACARLGRERAEVYYRAFDDAVDTVERLVREHEIACHFRRSGKILLAAKPKHYQQLQRAHAALSDGVDSDVRLIDADAVAGEVNSPLFHGGLMFGKSAQLHIGMFGAGLARAARQHGAQLFEGAHVGEIERLQTGGFVVRSSRGKIQASAIFVATGAHTDKTFRYFQQRILPVGSFVIATQPLGSDQIDAVMPGRRNAVTTLNVGNYFRVSHDNRLIFGGRARFALSSPASDRKSGEVLKRQLTRIFPQLGRVAVDYCWGGLVDMTQDRLPHAGQNDGLFHAMGYSGHGVQMSVQMGQIMARVIAGETDANPWRDRDWPPIPAHWARSWFMPFVGAYYRARDLVA